MKKFSTALFALMLSWQAAEAADVIVYIQGVSSAEGKLAASLHLQGKHVTEQPVDSQESRDFSASKENAFLFLNVAPGNYYVAIFHDRNNTGYERGYDGLGFSGPGNFLTVREALSSANFSVGTEMVVMTIMMRYDY